MQVQLSLAELTNKKINLLVRVTGAESRSELIARLVDAAYTEKFNDADPDRVELRPAAPEGEGE